MAHGVEVGDLFVSSWGYDQTNVDVYEVVGVTASSVRLMKGDSKVVDGQVVPVAGNPSPFTGHSFVGKPNARGEITKFVKIIRDEPYISLNSYSGARLWDGSRGYYSTHASGSMGH